MDLIVKSHPLNFNRLSPWKVSLMLCLVYCILQRGTNHGVRYGLPHKCPTCKLLCSVLGSQMAILNPQDFSYAACELVESFQGSQFMQ